MDTLRPASIRAVVVLFVRKVRISTLFSAPISAYTLHIRKFEARVFSSNQPPSEMINCGFGTELAAISTLSVSKFRALVNRHPAFANASSIKTRRNHHHGLRKRNPNHRWPPIGRMRSPSRFTRDTQPFLIYHPERQQEINRPQAVVRLQSHRLTMKMRHRRSTRRTPPCRTRRRPHPLARAPHFASASAPTCGHPQECPCGQSTPAILPVEHSRANKDFPSPKSPASFRTPRSQRYTHLPFAKSAGC